MRLLQPASKFRWLVTLIILARYIASAMYRTYWKIRRRQLRRKLSLLSINCQGQLVVRLFLQATCKPVWGLRVVRHRYLFFAH